MTNLNVIVGLTAALELNTAAEAGSLIVGTPGYAWMQSVFVDVFVLL